MARFNPLDYPISLVRPEHIAPSTWVTHTPFAMFLVDLLRPSMIVELGTQYGVSYCAFCQAVDTLKLNVRCYAVDTWQGDPHAGEYGQNVINDLRTYHDPRYGTFSRLIQSTFEDALNDFENGTIDLLHIDGYHTYEAVKNDFTHWLPKLSERGVLLLHDICVKENNFGVWKLWNEIKENYPSFEFSHGYGLGVLAVGKKYPPSLDLLIQPSDDLPAIKDYFSQMGSNVEKEQVLHEHSRQTVHELSMQIAQLSMQVTQKEQAIEAIINSRSWKLVSALRRVRDWFLPVKNLK